MCLARLAIKKPIEIGGSSNLPPSLESDNSTSDESLVEWNPEGHDNSGGEDGIEGKDNTGGAGQETSGSSSTEESSEGNTTSSGAESEEGVSSGGKCVMSHNETRAC